MRASRGVFDFKTRVLFHIRVILSPSEGSHQRKSRHQTRLSNRSASARPLCPSRTGVVFAVRDDTLEACTALRYHRAEP
jgi:hypothetical protein